jgi:hypothetical protein
VISVFTREILIRVSHTQTHDGRPTARDSFFLLLSRPSSAPLRHVSSLCPIMFALPCLPLRQPEAYPPLLAGLPVRLPSRHDGGHHDTTTHPGSTKTVKQISTVMSKHIIDSQCSGRPDPYALNCAETNSGNRDKVQKLLSLRPSLKLICAGSTSSGLMERSSSEICSLRLRHLVVVKKRRATQPPNQLLIRARSWTNKTLKKLSNPSSKPNCTSLITTLIPSNIT